MKYPISVTKALEAVVRRAMVKQRERRLIRKAVKAAKRETS
jgi:hypothetical protein